MRLLATFLVLLASTVAAQTTDWVAVGVKDVYSYVEPSAGVGDVDQDGYTDLMVVVGAPDPIYRRCVCLNLLSGRDGQILRTIPAVGFNQSYDTVCAAGDWNADGMPDYATTIIDGFPSTRIDNRVQVRSGLDDTVLTEVRAPWTTLFGRSLAGDLDVNGDGKPDLVASMPRWDVNQNLAAVRVFSNDGSMLYEVISDTQVGIAGFQGPHTVAGIGDLDRDGADDFIVGGADHVLLQLGIFAFSGRTGQRIVFAAEPAGGRNLGHCVDGCGDVDGDGYPDFVGGNTATFRTGAVVVFSGRSGQPIHVWNEPLIGTSFWGHEVRSQGIDLDRDSVPDILVGAPFFGGAAYGYTGAVFAFSGRTGDEIYRITTKEPYGAYMGDSIAVLGSMPGVPFPSFVVGEPGYSGMPPYNIPFGRLTAFRGLPNGAKQHGIPCLGTLTQAPVLGIRGLGFGVRISASQAPAASVGLWLLGLSNTTLGGLALPVQLGFLGLPGCSNYTSNDVVVPFTTGASGLSSGYASIDVPVPLQAAGAARVYAQAWCLPPMLGTGLGATTDALSWPIQ